MKINYIKDFRIRIYKTLLLSIGLFVALISFGTIGYIIIEDAYWFDALYMVVITASTVGFYEVFDLSTAGRVFTMVMILFNLAFFTYAITKLSTLFLDGEFRKYLKQRNMENVLNNMTDHVIICGFGRLGHAISSVLEQQKIPFIIIEKDIEKIRMHKERNYIFIEGNATNDEIIDVIGLERAKAIVATLPSDAENVFLVLSAKEKSNKITIYSRASDPENVYKLKMAGAHEVILPEYIGGAYIGSKIAATEIVDYNHFFSNLVKRK
jgi:voltage-gated potassium channel